MSYIPVIGLEIHAELLTKSKLFCSCPNEFGGDKNTRVCDYCTGIPGTLPNLNKNAMTLAVKAGIALGCKINNYSAFDRKNYFYPDLPKGYQITQFENPICTDGFVNIGQKKIRINNIHIEEDAGKLIHDLKNETSEADYNRAGVPLIEIVTEPDFNSAEEVVQFVGDIALRLKYAGVCDAKMDQGSLRVDVNISLMPENSNILGTRAEIKNLNSVRSISEAIAFEIKRQSELLEEGKEIIRETRRFDERKSITTSMRTKEGSDDYRYFPEPDIKPVFISDDEIDYIRNSMPQMPGDRYFRYIMEYKLSEDDAKLIISSKEFSDFFDVAVSVYGSFKTISGLMLGEVSRCLNEGHATLNESKLTPQQLALTAKMSDEEIISKNAAKEIVSILFKNGGEAENIAKSSGFIMDNDIEELEAVINKILNDNANLAEEYKKGNEKLFGFFMGQLVRTIGKGANPKIAKKLLLEKLNN